MDTAVRTVAAAARRRSWTDKNPCRTAIEICIEMLKLRVTKVIAAVVRLEDDAVGMHDIERIAGLGDSAVHVGQRHRRKEAERSRIGADKSAPFVIHAPAKHTRLCGVAEMNTGR
jgi:hypothetical protein